MANNIAAAVGQTQIYNDFVLKGFVATLAPLMSFANDVSPAPSERGYTVNVSFVPSGSSPTAFVEGTGYTGFNSTREAKAVSLDKHYYVGSSLSDKEIANSSLVKLEDTAYNDGAELATYIFQDVISKISGSNFPNGYQLAGSASLVTADSLIQARKVAGNLKVPVNNRNIILNVDAYHGLLSDDDFKYIYKGNTETVSNGVITNFFGVKNVWETNGYPTGLVSGSARQVGTLVSKDALLFAMRYLQPAPEASGAGVVSAPLTDPTTGITIGVRTWYDPTVGATKRVYEALWGSAVGNNKAAINLTTANP